MRSIAPNMFSTTAMSNLFTMGIAGEVNPNHKLPSDGYVIPNESIRRLRAKLILEEALETIFALGFTLSSEPNIEPANKNAKQTVADVLDGCCDLIYVATGTMLSCGAPDVPHQTIVNVSNNAKFPEGVGIFNKEGKYLKPKDWKAPNHQELIDMAGKIDLHAISQAIVSQAQKKSRAYGQSAGRED